MGLGHVFSGAPTYVRRFGVLGGIFVGIQTLGPRLRRRNTRTSIRVPGLRGRLLLRARTSDLRAFQQIFVDGDHDLTLPDEPKVIVDAGANVGFASVAFASRFPRAQIVALEVDAGNYAMLCQNVAAYPNVHPVHAGLWSHQAQLKIDNPSDEAWAFRVSPTETSSPSTESIPALGVLDVCRLAGVETIDILKIDIEGAELDVFSRDVETWIDRVQVIMIELHDHLRPGCGAALDAATAGRFAARHQQGEYHFLTRSG